MPETVRKLSILIPMLFEMISMTGIVAFYPLIASSQGFPTWLIGLVFSSCPLASLLLSPFIPTLMEKLGRRAVLLLGLMLIAFGDIMIGLIITTPLSVSIFLSFLGRSLIGAGYGCSLISTYAILTSDYPEETAKMVAAVEIFFGIGISIGPSFGSVLFNLFGFFYTLLVLALLNLIMVPILFVILGKMREYKIRRDSPISLIQMMGKFKIVLDFGVQTLMLFGLGFLLPTTGFHLMSYGLAEDEIGYFYSISTFAYLVSSIAVSFIPKRVNKPRVMVFGVFLMGVGFLLIGPTRFLFERSLVTVGFGLFIIGFSGGLMYVPSLPHMLEIAIRDYGYVDDDRLNDALSGMVNMSISIGEVVGPTVASLLYSEIGYSDAGSLMCVLLIGYGIVYAVFSNAFRRIGKKSGLVRVLDEEGMT